MERSLRRVRWLLGLLLGGTCVTLHFFGVDLPRTTEVTLPSVSESSAGLQSHTIIAYSLERQVEMEQRTPVNCPYRLVKPKLEDRPMWQKPTHTGVYMYSAHYDTRLSYYHYVRIVGMAEGGGNTSLYCRVWYRHAKQPLVLEALVSIIWVTQWDENTGEQASNTYRPILLSCPIPKNVGAGGHVPTSVSVTRHPCEHTKIILPISTFQVDNLPKNFVICVKGLDFPLQDISKRLVEWFELNLILGADTFFIYVYSVHPNVKRVLDFYSSLGVAIITPLTLPGRQPNEPLKRSKYLRSHLWQKRRDELVPYNDCFYRNLHTHRYVIPLDIDEIIVPVKGQTWSDVFNDIDVNVIDKYASFSVRNAYFFDNFPVTDTKTPEYLHVLRHLVRSANFSPPEEAVKSFVSTSTALTVFNHYALQPLDPALGRNFVLDLDLVQMNHYKSECSPLMIRDCDTNFLKYTTKDTIILKYKHELTRRVVNVLNDLNII